MPSHRFKHHITPTGLCNWAIAHLEHVPWALKSASLEKESPDVTITRWWFQRFFFTPKIGEDEPFFNWGWFNHQQCGHVGPSVSPPIFMEFRWRFPRWRHAMSLGPLMMTSGSCWFLVSPVDRWTPARKPPGMYQALWILGYLQKKLGRISEPSTGAG